MDVLNTVAALRASLARGGEPGRHVVAFVPTMGYFHEGHLALMKHARKMGEARGSNVTLIASLFVNPRQFGPNEDFKAYPRDFHRDRALAQSAGCDILFAPDVGEVYPDGFATSVVVGRAGTILDGIDRPGHFDGVATVVLKLFNMVRPTLAVFGWKDAQQFLILKMMVRDLDLPVEMVGMETMREPDLLAMSSRNTYLTAEERAQAPTLYRGLIAAARTLRAADGTMQSARAAYDEALSEAPLFHPIYLTAVSIDRLEPLDRWSPGNTLLATAARIGRTRLIDNVRL